MTLATGGCWQTAGYGEGYTWSVASGRGSRDHGLYDLAGVCGVAITADLAQELAAESDRLGQLAYEDGSGTAAPSVAAAFELSYRRLDETAAQVFRLLPVNPGPDISTAAAAVLADLAAGKARTVLAAARATH